MTANSFGSRATIEAGGASHEIYRLDAVAGSENLPYSLKILLENLLRNEDGVNVTTEHISALASWDAKKEPDTEIQFTPARVILQDLTGVPAVVDLAAMREAMQELGGDATKINPLIPAELVIDHSVVADVFGRPDAFEKNVQLEFQRNRERFQFLRWGQQARRTRTPASAPTPTPPCRTVSASSAGESAASRRRRPCSASRSPC